MSSVTDKYIDNLYELTRMKFPERVVLQAKKCLLDYIGVTFAGAAMLKEKGNAFLNNSEKGDVSAIGFGKKTNLYNAALINGMSSHVADLDDGIRQGNFHPGSPIISALLPVASQYGLTGGDFLRGVIVGYEAAIRLAIAIQPSHRQKGYHAIGTCGTIGVTLGIGAALKYSRQQMKNALSAAATSSSGMLNVIKGESELSPYNAGQATVSGIAAALIAQAGFIGSADVLTGQWGFIEMMTDRGDLSLLENTTEIFGIEKIYFKQYAACRHCHPAIESMLFIKNNYEIELEEIKEVIVETYSLAANGRDHADINGITDAKFSIPYSVAVAFIKKKAGIEEYSKEMFHDKQILELAKKVKIIANEDLDAVVPEKRPAIVKINTHNQKHFSFRVDLAKGEPEIPISVSDLEEKYFSLFSYAKKEQYVAQSIMKCVWNIEKDMETLLLKL